MSSTMHKNAITLAGGGVLILVTALALRSHHSAPTTGGIPLPPPSLSPSSVAVSSVNPPFAPDPFQPKVDAESDAKMFIQPLPANATHVPDEDLLKLSVMVDLTDAEEAQIDKVRWSQAVPIAEQLVKGPCDCEQRNWLNHFIAMGEDALDGSEERYHQTAGLMRKTARSDQQLADHPELFAR